MIHCNIAQHQSLYLGGAGIVFHSFSLSSLLLLPDERHVNSLDWPEDKHSTSVQAVPRPGFNKHQDKVEPFPNADSLMELCPLSELLRLSTEPPGFSLGFSKESESV